MPYLKDDDKDDVNQLKVGTAFYRPEDQTSGKLTYALYRLCVNFLGSAPRFYDLCVVVGALVCTLLEVYRRRIAPYEDTKIAKNGDVS